MTTHQADVAHNAPASNDGRMSVPADEIESFGDGHIQARHGRVNRWLVVVYAILFAWSIYYGIVFWGGQGPGLAY